MADWYAITDAQVDPDAPLTSELAYAWRDNPVAMAEGALGAPRVSAKARSTNLMTWATFNNTTPHAITSMDWVKSIRLDGAVAQSTNASAGILQVSFSTDGGANWGSWQNLCSSTSNGAGINVRTYSVIVEVDLLTGNSTGGIVGGAAIDTAVNVTVPSGYNSIRFKTSAAVNYGVIITAEGGRDDV